jgi:hypothetical protein
VFSGFSDGYAEFHDLGTLPSTNADITFSSSSLMTISPAMPFLSSLMSFFADLIRPLYLSASCSRTTLRGLIVPSAPTPPSAALIASKSNSAGI